MTDENKLTLLLVRAKNLRYNDSNDLDDIIQKTKMCLDLYFPLKPTYAGEVGRINFAPSTVISGMDNSIYISAFQRGKEKLINLLDTRIEEYQIILNSQKGLDEVKVMERIVKVEDMTKVKQLEKKIELLEALPKGYDMHTKIGITTVILIVIGAAFSLGLYFGNNKFDQSKIDLIENNKKSNLLIDSLTKQNIQLKNSKEKMLPNGTLPKAGLEVK